jgi:serine/threonine protein kinase
MDVVCPSCEVLPGPEAGAGTRCRGCGAGLVTVTATEPKIGTVIDGRFEVKERLGAGAMGVVYRATQLSIGRDIALKILSSIESATAIKRFFREAKIASALSHPNTVPIIEFGQEPNGHVYLAMELVRGRTLHAELEHGPLTSRRITRIGIQLCEALEAAHRLQIVHRDLKLENVMISVDGSDHIKVLDFGIARIVGDASSQVTGIGLSAGTPHYMAPEVLGEAADPAPAQDIYALGVILAELALGGPLWTNVASLPMLLVEKITNTAVERVPLRLRPLVGQLLAPAPADRPTPGEIRRTLREIDRFATDTAGVAALLPPPARTSLGSAPTAFELEPLTPVSTHDLVSLDARDATRPDVPPASVFLPPPSATPPRPDTEVELHLDNAKTRAAGFGDTPLARDASPKLELEPGWVTSRAARQLSPASDARRGARTHAASRASGSGHWLVLLLVVAAVAGAVAYKYLPAKAPHAVTEMPFGAPYVAPVVVHAPLDATSGRSDAPGAVVDAGRPARAASSHVSIRIVGRRGVAITIDGEVAGVLPLELERSAGKRPILIEGPGIYRRIIPDRTQIVDLSAPER